MSLELPKKAFYEIQKTVQNNVGNDRIIEVKIQEKKPKGKLPPAVFIFQKFALEASKILSPSALQVIIYFIGITEFGNYVSMDILTLSEELKLSEKTSWRALKELKEKGIVVEAKHGQDKRRKDYWLHPDAVFKGGSADRIKKRLEMQEQGLIPKQENPNQQALW